MTGKRSAKHRTELISAALRSAILERALLPGMKLPEDSLGERFGASRTLIHQALERLAAEGLVELRRNRGAVVATPSLEEARDLFDLREHIEDLVVKRLAANFDEAKHAALKDHIAREVDAEKQPESVSIRLATEFHILLAELTGSPVLLRYVQEIGYRCGLTLTLYSRPHSTDCGIQEHRDIVAALAEGDSEAARAKMCSHLGAVAARAHITPEGAAPVVYLDALEPYVRMARQ